MRYAASMSMLGCFVVGWHLGVMFDGIASPWRLAHLAFVSVVTVFFATCLFAEMRQKGIK